MKIIVIISALTTVALAQSSASSASASNPTANPLIPTGISSACESFLDLLDSDTGFSSCTTPLIAATSQFGPNSNSTSTPSSSMISSTLSNMCSTSASSCTDQIVRSKLTAFYSTCTAELTTNPNADVLRTYDVLYALIPLKQAVCTKDDSSKYCVTEISTPSSSTVSNAKVDVTVNTMSNARQWLWSTVSNTKRATTQTPAVIPNTTTFRSTNLLFFFLQPQANSTTLCTTCTRSVLMSYIDFEQSVPYGPGLANSPLMGGQPDLYNAVINTCGKNFFGGVVQAAGGISGGMLGSSAGLRSVSHTFGGFVATVMGTVAVAIL